MTITTHRPLLCMAAFVALLVAGVATAKEGGTRQTPHWQAVPTYTTVDLSSGFTPDPWTQELEAGGDMEVSTDLAPACAGNIHGEAPDVDLNFDPGNYSLFIRARSQADTTLVVFGPEGRWYCNDDFVGTDPVVVFPNPPAGNYNIWVGVYGSTQLSDATLEITEINPAR